MEDFFTENNQGVRDLENTSRCQIQPLNHFKSVKRIKVSAPLNRHLLNWFLVLKNSLPESLPALPLTLLHYGS